LIVIKSDDINGVNQAELARTLEDYGGLMQDFPGVEDVVLQPNRRSLLIQFTSYAMFAGSAPDFRDVIASTATLHTRAQQRAVDSNPAIGENASVSGVRSVGDVVDDDNNTARIVGGRVLTRLSPLAVIFMAWSKKFWKCR
jgi:hypothetical protein